LDVISHADPIVQIVMGLLVIASVVSWSVVLEKVIQLTLFGGQVRRFEKAASAPLDLTQSRAWLAAAILGEAQRMQFAQGETALERGTRLERAMRLVARVRMSALQRRVRVLATIGATAPFVGLFGTVWGIMNSFTAIAQQKDTSLAVVAPGIAEALFATALGLAAAIPAVIAYNQISGAIGRLSERINIAVATLANELVRTRVSAGS
jgi:biopolymer transport protein ExbB/TolQ